MKKILLSLSILGFLTAGVSLVQASPLETLVDQILLLRSGSVLGDSVSLPTVTTTEITGITEQSALVNGNVTSSGGATVTKRGIVWGLSLNPTIEKDLPYQQQDASAGGTGYFTARAYALSPDTTYHARTYAINSVGTAYGNDLTFKTAKVGSITAPIVITSQPTKIAPTSVTLGGDITSDGGTTIRERGVVWATSSNPTTSSLGKSSDESWATGAFTKNITGLTPNTTYYARAYATNDRGTSYGSNVSFKTLAVVNGVWTAWANQGGCVNNKQTQVRTCTNPAPANGGAPCSGDATQTINCTPNPYVKVTYPNGGEVFTAGQPINIQWTSNYVGSNELVNVYLYVPSRNLSIVVAIKTPNDGSEMFYDTAYLDDFGKVYKVIVSPFTVAVVQDTSDDFFTINKATASPVNGGWSAWINSGSCGVNGLQTQTRTCTNPTPANGGAQCSGDATQTISCSGSNPSIPVPPCGSYGDVNGDGYISDNDVAMIGQMINGTGSFTDAQEAKADVNADGAINITDKNLVINYSTKTITTFPACSTNSTPSITVLSPNGGEKYVKGEPIKIELSGGLYLAKVGIVSPDFDPNKVESDSNDINWLPVSSERGLYLVWDGSSITDFDGNKNYWSPGLGNHKIVAIRNENSCFKEGLSKLSDCVYDISDNYFTIISQCANGTVNYPVCNTLTNGGCINGATNPPLCTVLPENVCKQISQPVPNFCPNGVIEPVIDSNQCIVSYKCVTSGAPSLPQCSDGIDNDMDGTIDQGDPNCHYGLDLNKGYVANFTSESSTLLLPARTLRVGSRGSDVGSLQKYLGLKADNIFGRMTASAVREWQAKNGLVADSVFGAKSFSKLMEEKMLLERSSLGQ